jgi:plasmid stabilization system protein ParE
MFRRRIAYRRQDRSALANSSAGGEQRVAIAAKARNLRHSHGFVGKRVEWSAAQEFWPMPRGDKSKYTDKQERKADHIEKSYESRGVPEKEAERRAWATVNKDDGGGKRAGGSGRGKSTGHPAAHKGGRKGGAAAAARSSASRSAAAKKGAATRKRNAARAGT